MRENYVYRETQEEKYEKSVMVAGATDVLHQEDEKDLIHITFTIVTDIRDKKMDASKIVASVFLSCKCIPCDMMILITGSEYRLNEIVMCHSIRKVLRFQTKAIMIIHPVSFFSNSSLYAVCSI